MNQLIAERSDAAELPPAQRAAPVRVCFLIDRLSRAGTETQLLALIREFDRSRVSPYLVLLDGESEESQALEPADCPVLRLGVRSLLSTRALSAAVTLARFFRREQIDILQAYFLDSIYFGVPVARLAGVPRVLRVRNNLGYWLTRKQRLLGRLYGKLVDLTLTNSEEGRAALIASDHLCAERVAVLENGVDVERFAGFALPDTSRAKVRIGAVANLRPVKGLDLLVPAAAEVLKSFPHIEFEVAGEGEQRAELERLIAELKLGGHFKLCGAVADVPAFLASLDVAVLSSRSEGMSNALLEYMAAGRAIVATRVGANSRLVRDGQDGLLVAPEDPAALAAAIARFLHDPASAGRCGESARRRAVESFSRAAMRQRFEQLYCELRSK